ncbi:MAG: hypothetical protein ABII12_00485, partial [Planctomycetota bacterium]
EMRTQALDQGLFMLRTAVTDSEALAIADAMLRAGAAVRFITDSGGRRPRFRVWGQVTDTEHFEAVCKRIEEALIAFAQRPKSLATD